MTKGKNVELDGDIFSSNSTQGASSSEGNHKIFRFSLKVETQNPTSRGNIYAKVNDEQQKDPACVTRHFFPLHNGELSQVLMSMLTECTGGDPLTESH